MERKRMRMAFLHSSIVRVAPCPPYDDDDAPRLACSLRLLVSRTGVLLKDSVVFSTDPGVFLKNPGVPATTKQLPPSAFRLVTRWQKQGETAADTHVNCGGRGMVLVKRAWNPIAVVGACVLVCVLVRQLQELHDCEGGRRASTHHEFKTYYCDYGLSL